MTISSRVVRALRALRVAVPALAFTQDSAWQVARPDYAWSFPRDHWAHPAYKTEWWYFTGHLADVQDSTRRFGYQFTIFRVGVLPRAPALGSDWAASMLVMGHASVTDLAAGTHTFSETLYRATPLLGGFGAAGDSLVAWSRAPAGTDGRWTLRWNDAAASFAFTMRDARRGIAFELAARSDKPLVLHGPNGFSRKSVTEGASLYYSYPRLTTTGTVEIGGRHVAVRGTSWMDKEFGSNQLAPEQVGWDWFSIQLDDGREVMLYSLRDSTGATTFRSGTVVGPQGVARYLAPGDFELRSTATWTSDSTHATYPAAWRVDIPSERLRLAVEPLLSDQENRSRLLRGLYYWEGAVGVRDAAGRAAGRGYVELVGYGKGLRPAI